MDRITAAYQDISTERSPALAIRCGEMRGSLQGAPVIPQDGNSSQSISFFKRLSSMSNPVLTVIFAVLFATQLIILSFLTVAWFSLFHVAQVAMPRTFAWEFVITFLGSYFNDCIQLSQSNMDDCTWSSTIPWIPLIGGATCLLTFFTVSWAVTEIVYYQKNNALWIKLLSFICSLDTVNWIILIVHFSTSFMYKGDLLEHMKFTMNRMLPQKLPTEIYFRWNISQTILKCCGIFEPGDWQFSQFPDPRFPESCCNMGADNLNFQCSQRRYPDRYHIHQDGCLPKEMSIVASYENWTTLLLVLSVISAIFLAAIILLLTIFTRKTPCKCQLFPRMKEINVTLLRRNISCRFDNHHYKKQQRRLPTNLFSCKKNPHGSSEFEESKSDNTLLFKETSV